ncbi:MAG: PilZ domain-containing protein [Kangiellaceae bacterium]|nr:PilZ domain-containing protein [Kangiellaceae bacterium]
MPDKDELIISHYKTVGRQGKSLIQEKVKDGSDTANFLKRMEQRRLAMPCYIAIDMRGKVADNCEAFKFHGLTHYLDDKCKAIFQSQTEQYDGKYTVGVFESVLGAEHTFKAKHERENKVRLAEKIQQEQKQKSIAPKDPLFQTPEQRKQAELEQKQEQQAVADIPKENIQIIPFGYRSQRKESRLNYTSNIHIHLPGGGEVSGKTSDISLAGIKLSLYAPIKDLNANDIVEISFNGLEEIYHLSFSKVSYKVIEQEQAAHSRPQLRLLRVDQTDNPQFNLFVEEFIDTHRSRYKIELGDNLLSLYAKAFERIYNAAAPSTVALLDLSSASPSVLFAGSHQGTGSDLTNILLAALMADLPCWIPADSSQSEQSRIILLEAFLLKGKHHYQAYVAERNKLLEDQQLDLFLRSGSQAMVINRIQLTIQPVDKEELDESALLLSSLTDSDPVKADNIARNWVKASHIAKLSVIEEKINNDSTLTDASRQIEPLAAYRLGSKSSPIWPLSYRNERQEERFTYSSGAEILSEKNKWPAQVLDFSANGMRLKLSNESAIPAQLSVNTKVKINLPDFQKLAKKSAKLSDLSYRVVKWHPDNKAISLKRDISVKQHQGELFFNRLIESNKAKLSECLEDQTATIVAMMIETLFSGYLSSIPLFVSRFPGGRLSAESAAATEHTNNLMWEFKSQDSFDFEPLNIEAVFADIIKPNLNRKGQLTQSISTRLFAEFSEQGGELLSITDEANMKDNREIAKFILMTRKNKNFHILRANFLPPPFIKLEEFSDDIKEVRANSAAKAKEFEKKVQGIVAIVDIEDISAFYSA